MTGVSAANEIFYLQKYGFVWVRSIYTKNQTDLISY